MESIEEIEESRFVVNNSILEFINRNFKNSKKLSLNVNNIKGLINFIKENNFDYLVIDIDFLIENSQVLKNTIDVISNNSEMYNLFINSEDKKLSSFFSQLLNYEQKDDEFEKYDADSSDIVHDYLKQIDIPLLNDEEFKTLYNQMKTGSEKARKKIIESNLRLVVNIAKKYINRGIPFIDIISYGNIGLIKAVDKFNLEKNCKFSTYATYWIRQSIMRSLEDYSRIVRLPSYLHNDIQKLKFFAGCFYSENGRMPDEYELAELMKTKSGKIQQLSKVNQNILYLDEPINEEKDSTFGEFIQDESDLEEETINQEYYNEFMNAFNRANLREREREVLLLRFGFYDNKQQTLEEIGNKYNVTKERIRQIEASGLRKLRQNKSIQKYKLSSI